MMFLNLAIRHYRMISFALLILGFISSCFFLQYQSKKIKQLSSALEQAEQVNKESLAALNKAKAHYAEVVQALESENAELQNRNRTVTEIKESIRNENDAPVADSLRRALDELRKRTTSKN